MGCDYTPKKGIFLNAASLTTGIDVPKISNLVFLRLVKSRILYEQMKGRATRLCPEIGKESFRIFDAVNLYEHLEPVTNMKPVVVNPRISFTQLIDETRGETTTTEAQQTTARDQLMAKLQRKKHRLSDAAEEQFMAITQQTPDDFIQTLKNQSIEQLKDTLANCQGLGQLLDKKDTPKPGQSHYDINKIGDNQTKCLFFNLNPLII